MPSPAKWDSRTNSNGDQSCGHRPEMQRGLAGRTSLAKDGSWVVSSSWRWRFQCHHLRSHNVSTWDPAEGLAEAAGTLPPAYLLFSDSKQLGGGIRALGSHFPGGSTISSSRNTSIPAMRSSRCSACQATLWKSCGEMLWFSHHIPVFSHSKPSSQPAAIMEKGTHPLQSTGCTYILQTHPKPLLSYPGQGRPPARPILCLPCWSLQRRGALVSSASASSQACLTHGCRTRLTSSVSSVAMALPTSW